MPCKGSNRSTLLIDSASCHCSASCIRGSARTERLVRKGGLHWALQDAGYIALPPKRGNSCGHRLKILDDRCAQHHEHYPGLEEIRLLSAGRAVIRQIPETTGPLSRLPRKHPKESHNSWHSLTLDAGRTSGSMAMPLCVLTTKSCVLPFAMAGFWVSDLR
jgi:hypothetical protein